MKTQMIEAPVISEDIWGDTPEELAYWTIRYYKPSGFGLVKEWTNVPAVSEQNARHQAQCDYRIPQGMMSLVYAFKQEKRV